MWHSWVVFICLPPDKFDTRSIYVGSLAKTEVYAKAEQKVGDSRGHSPYGAPREHAGNFAYRQTKKSKLLSAIP